MYYLLDCGVQSDLDGEQAYPAYQGYNLGTGTGTVTLNFNGQSIPDRFIVRHDNQVVIDTGYRGGSIYNYGGTSRSNFTSALNGLADPITGITYPYASADHAADNYPIVTSPGLGTAEFNKTSATITSAQLEVYGPMASTAWTATLGCPAAAGSPTIVTGKHKGK